MKAYRDFLHLLLSHFLKEGASGLSGLAFLCSEPVMTDLLRDPSRCSYPATFTHFAGWWKYSNSQRFSVQLTTWCARGTLNSGESRSWLLNEWFQGPCLQPHLLLWWAEIQEERADLPRLIYVGRGSVWLRADNWFFLLFSGSRNVMDVQKQKII